MGIRANKAPIKAVFSYALLVAKHATEFSFQSIVLY